MAEYKELTSEKDIERLLVRRIKEAGGVALKLLSDQHAGLPDRLCLLPGGRAFFAELKSKGKKPRKIQEVAHNMLRGLGFNVYVIDSGKGVEDVVKEETDYGRE